MRTRLLAVQTVLQSIKVDIGKLSHYKVVERTICTRELVRCVSVVNFRLNLRQTSNHQLVQRRQIIKGNGVTLGLKLILQLREQEAISIAEATICVRSTSQNLVVNSNVRRCVNRSNPQTNNVGAHLVTNLVGVNNVTKRLGHLATLTIKRKALRHNSLKRCHIIRAYRRK